MKKTSDKQPQKQPGTFRSDFFPANDCDIEKYNDILYMPHPVSQKHPPMPLKDRAAQFMPFAALTGHTAAIKETARQAEIDYSQNFYIPLEEE